MRLSVTISLAFHFCQTEQSRTNWYVHHCLFMGQSCSLSIEDEQQCRLQRFFMKLSPEEVVAQILNCICIDPDIDSLRLQQSWLVLTGPAAAHGCARFRRWRSASRGRWGTSRRASSQGSPSCCCTCSIPCTNKKIQLQTRSHAYGFRACLAWMLFFSSSEKQLKGWTAELKMFSVWQSNP